ncbi:MAG: hypothetical protein WBP11_07330 [Dokdonella sp.]
MNLITELKQRNVYRAATLYAATGWLLVQITTQVLPFFDVPNWVERIIVIAVFAGFPVAMLLSWFYDWSAIAPPVDETDTDADAEAEPVEQHSTRRKLDRWIIAALSLALIVLVVDQLFLNDDGTAQAGESIAVLPFSNASDDKAEQYFSDGLSDDLISALSQFSGLRVVSRNSSFQFRDSNEDSRSIAEKLGVKHLLDGTVRRAGTEVRITAELINSADGSTLWSQSYVRPYVDLFDLQAGITKAVAEQLKATLLADPESVRQSEHPPSGNLDAYNAYLQGRFYEARGTEADFRKAIEFYQRAASLDDRYALAQARLSAMWTTLSGRFLEGVEMRRGYSMAREAVDRALSLDNDLAAAHVARGMLMVWNDFDWTGGEAEYHKALELLPNDSAATALRANLLAALGRIDEAVEQIRLSLATDALNAHSKHRLGVYLMAQGKLDESAQAFRDAIELQPDANGNYEQLTIVSVLRGDLEAAVEFAQQEPKGDWRDAAMARALQIGDDRAAADAALQLFIDKQAGKAAYQIAQVYALRGDGDQVFAWLARAWDSRDPGIGLLLYDPLLNAYRLDPRFAALCREVGLPKPAAALPLPSR